MEVHLIKRNVKTNFLSSSLNKSVTFPPSLKPPSSESPRTIKRTRGVLAGEIGRRWSRSLTSVTDCLAILSVIAWYSLVLRVNVSGIVIPSSPSVVSTFEKLLLQGCELPPHQVVLEKRRQF